MTGLSDQGLTIKRLDEIKTELDEGLKIIFGQELSSDPSTPQSQMNGQIAEDISVLYEIAQAVYAGLNPNYSSGNMLDLVSGIRGVVRKKATATQVIVDFTGTDGTVVPVGTLFSDPQTPSITFSLDASKTLPDSGAASCTILGPVAVIAGTLTSIINPISGLTAVNNPEDGSVGVNEESDEELRIRSNASVALPSTSILEGMEAGIANVLNVTEARVGENTTSITDPITGISPKSMLAIVNGGDEQDIAEVIFNRKSLGCGMDGDIEVNVLDSNNYAHPIRFSRPTLVPIHVQLDLKELSDWDPALIPNIKQSLVDYATGASSTCSFTGYSISDDVYASQLYGAYINSGNAFSVNSILVEESTPAGNLEVIIDLSELATFSVDDITVVSAP